MKKMKVKDLEDSVDPITIKVKYRGGIYKVISGWNSGPNGGMNLWLMKEEDIGKNSHPVYPVIHPEAENLEVVDYEKMKEKCGFGRGEKVLFVPENKVYDFGYIGQTGKAIIYEEGEMNMQDSHAVDIKDLRRLK